MIGSLVRLAFALQVASSPAEPPPYETVRWREDWSSFEPREHDDPTLRLKNLRLGSVTSLSIGGQLRLRTELLRTDGTTEDLQLYRGLLHADLRGGQGFRTFVEIGTALAFGSQAPVRPIDENLFSVRQAFAEVHVGSERWRLRAGRQELPLGSGRLVALRDGPNVRLSFDGLRLTFEHQRGTVDAFGLAAVAERRGPVDDFSDPGDTLWGVYSTTRVVGQGRLSLDGYYLGVRREGARFGDDEGVQLRHSLGTRVFGAIGPYDYNLEIIGQAGTFAGRPIAAWTVASDQGITAPWSTVVPRLGLRANVTSGGSTGSGPLRTFDALHPNLAYFSQAALIAPANHVDLHPRLTVDVLERVQFEVAGDWFWRTSLADAIYEPPGVPIGAVGDHRGRFVGTELTASVEASLGRHATVTAYVSQLWAGRALRSVGRADATFLAFWLSYLF